MNAALRTDSRGIEGESYSGLFYICAAPVQIYCCSNDTAMVCSGKRQKILAVIIYEDAYILQI